MAQVQELTINGIKVRPTANGWEMNDGTGWKRMVGARVQSGIAVTGAQYTNYLSLVGFYYVDVTIDAVDISRCEVTVNSNAYFALLNSTTIRLFFSTQNARVQWQVIEYA